MFKKLQNSRNGLGLVFMAPATVLLVLFLTYPLGLGVWLGFTDTKIGRAGLVVADGAYSPGFSRYADARPVPPDPSAYLRGLRTHAMDGPGLDAGSTGAGRHLYCLLPAGPASQGTQVRGSLWSQVQAVSRRGALCGAKA